MSIKLGFIPFIDSYKFIRDEMENDLEYRLESRHLKTSLGRPLYNNINVQIVMTHECPFSCPFCLERQNPMTGKDNFEKQIESLKSVLYEHPNARLTITGGEPGLYPQQVKSLVETYKENSNNVFCCVNTVGISEELNGLAHINLSKNDYVDNDHTKFPGCTVQTVLEEPTIEYIKNYMWMNAERFSFRFLTSMDKKDYPVDIWNNIQSDKNIEISTFRIGDFFVYATFNYMGKHARLTLGDMWQQRHNDYKDGYSNIIIHPDGKVSTNWK